jgi:hypothetical protein
MSYSGAEKEMHERLEKMTELPQMYAGSGYDWDDFNSWYDPEARIFYWGQASGCSCNHFWDDFSSLGDFQTGRKEDLLRAAKEWADSNFSYKYSELSKEDYNAFTAAVRAIKVAA